MPAFVQGILKYLKDLLSSSIENELMFRMIQRLSAIISTSSNDSNIYLQQIFAADETGVGLGDGARRVL